MKKLKVDLKELVSEMDMGENLELTGLFRHGDGRDHQHAGQRDARRGKQRRSYR